MKRTLLLGLIYLTVSTVACGLVSSGGTLCCSPPQPPTNKILQAKIVDGMTQQPLVGAHAWIQAPDGCGLGDQTSATADTNGLVNFSIHRFGCMGTATVTFSMDGYEVQIITTLIPASDGTMTPANILLAPLPPPFPAPASRDEILMAHESFQGALLHTSCFGDLHWWPTAWTSLPDGCREESYAQIAAWGDTDITVSASWEYGEANQPYGTGQLVPATDLTGNWPRFRALVKEVLQHTAANGKPFVPVIFMAGDFGFNYYMWEMPLVMAALEPQPDDPIDLTPYVKIRMCYDSCVPGWQPKEEVAEAILATRARCPGCVIAMEFASGYSSWGDGIDNFLSPAGQALDEWDWEGNTWPPDNWEQYWEIFDRWFGPAYHRPSQQVSDPPPVIWYMRQGTPRGPWIGHCFEPFTYLWVHYGRPDDAGVEDAFQTLQALGCPSIDMPYVRPAR